MIYRLFIAFFLFVFVIYVLKAIARLRFFINGTMGDVRKLREQLGGAGGGPEMVRCPGCGAFVAAREAVTIRSRNISQSYCSTECLQRHIK